MCPVIANKLFLFLNAKKSFLFKAFKAGCDLVLHCNSRYDEMIEVAKKSPKVNAFITKKTSQFYKILS